MSSCVVMSKTQLGLPEKQGIVSILSPSAASLRRTLSADMSSKTWLSLNGLISPSPIKKTASFCNSISEYSSSTHGDDDEEEEEDEQFNKEKRLNPAELDIWSLIASQPQQHDHKSAAPYVHPMLKRSASTLSQRSLQVCTESLGSETGSDDFSYQSSEDQLQPQQQQQQSNVVDFDFGYDYEDVKVVKYKMGAVGRKLPPPLPCTSLRMKPRREDGRLVLEAVSVSSQNNFKAERQDGRLLLTFVNPQQQEADDQQEEQNSQDAYNCHQEEEVEIKMMEQTPKVRVIEHHRLALMMNKSAPINNPTHQMYNKFQEETCLLLPPPPPAAGLLNGYDYCWRAKPTAAQAMEKNSNSKHLITKNNTSILPLPDQQQKSAMTNYNYNIRGSWGCKNHHTRSFFWDWDPYSIATATS